MLDPKEKKRIIQDIGEGGWKVVIFDIDGTLLPHTSANHAIFSMLGALEVMKRFEADYAAGVLDNDKVANALAKHFAGYRPEDLTAFLRHTDFIEDAIELSQTLRKAGVTVLVATVTWRFVADWVADQLNGEAISGVELEERSGVFTGKVERHAYDDDKTKSLQKWCKSRDVTLQECIAVGDSRSDLHIFDNVGLSLAINPSDAAKVSATYAGDFDTLWQLFADAPLNSV